MSGKHALQTETTAPQQPQRADHTATSPRQFCVGDPVPYVLTLEQLAGFLQISVRALHDLRKTRTHPGIKELDAPGDPRFCGRTLKTWLEQGTTSSVGRRYFGSARR